MRKIITIGLLMFTISGCDGDYNSKAKILSSEGLKTVEYIDPVTREYLMLYYAEKISKSLENINKNLEEINRRSN